MSKQWQTVRIPIGFGLAGKTDVRAINPPDLSIASDVEFEEVGGLQTRKPLSSLGLTVAPGSTAIVAADLRRVEQNGDELLLFTAERLYSWDASNSWWIERDTHLATVVDEHSRFTTPDDQLDVDRAELNGCVITTWHVLQSGGGLIGWVAAHNATTGAVMMSPQAIAFATRLRVIALDTKILFSFRNTATGTGVSVVAIDPTNPAAAVATVLAGASTNVFASTVAGPYDVCRVVGADQAAYAAPGATLAAYHVATVTAALVTASSVKARGADIVGVSCSTTGVLLVVRRTSPTTLVADQVTASTLVDTALLNVALGTSTVAITQIAIAWRTTLNGGAYRCYAYWNDLAGDGSPSVRANWIDSAGTTGTAAQFMAGVTVASKPFSRQRSGSTTSNVFVWLVFAEASTFDSGAESFSYQLQNTYFLYRDDAHLCGKAVAGKASGPINQNCWLATVQAISANEYRWGAAERRIITIGGAGQRRRDYAARGPREVFFTFDDNRARRVASIGQTLYVAGGEIKQYDGVRLAEVGFHIFPWYLDVYDATIAASPIEAGTYAIKFTPRWDNARGEIDRGTTASTRTIVLAATRQIGALTDGTTVTHKTAVSLEVWRTPKNPTADSPFYLVSSKDPTATTGNNAYVVNDPTAIGHFGIRDNLADASITANEQCPENAGLESLSPPPASIIAANADRLFLAGIAGDPHSVWYSKTRSDGLVCSFHEQLSFAVPAPGGPITGLGFLNETLIVFKDSAIYALPGDGYDNAGNGGNYGPARVLSVDIGASDHDSIALTPLGLVFHSRKGKYLLNRGWGVDYIGAPVADYDAEGVYSVQVVEAQHQVRWVTPSRVLVHDYIAKTQADQPAQWAVWTIPNGLDATLWNHQWLVLSSTVGPQSQRSDFTGVNYGQDVATAWLKMGDVLQGAGSIRWFEILGEYRGACSLQVSLYRDYQTAPYQTTTWTPSALSVGDPLQVRIGPSIPKCEAFKVRVKVFAADGVSAPTTEGIKLSGLDIELGLDRGLFRGLPAAKKAS